MVNKIILIGHLGEDTREINGGFAKFSLATSEKYKAKDGEVHQKTEWHSVVIFNENLVKFALNYLKKGMKVFVEGKITYRSHEDEMGNKKKFTDIIVGNTGGEIKILDNKKDNDNNGNTSNDY